MDTCNFLCLNTSHAFKIKFSHSNLKGPHKTHPTHAYLPAHASHSLEPWLLQLCLHSLLHTQCLSKPVPEHSTPNLSRTHQTSLLFAPVNRGLPNTWLISPWRQGETKLFDPSNSNHMCVSSVRHLSASGTHSRITLWNEPQQVSNSVGAAARRIHITHTPSTEPERSIQGFKNQHRVSGDCILEWSFGSSDLRWNHLQMEQNLFK